MCGVEYGAWSMEYAVCRWSITNRQTETSGLGGGMGAAYKHGEAFIGIARLYACGGGWDAGCFVYLPILPTYLPTYFPSLVWAGSVHSVIHIYYDTIS